MSPLQQKVKEARKARCASLTEGILACGAAKDSCSSGSFSARRTCCFAMEAQYLLDHLDQYKSAVLGKSQSKVHITPMPPHDIISVSPIV